MTEREHEWAHLLPMVDALVRAGYKTEGFRQNQGGWDCVVNRRLKRELLAPLIAADPHADQIGLWGDALNCMHCWAGIVVMRPRGIGWLQRLFGK